MEKRSITECEHTPTHSWVTWHVGFGFVFLLWEEAGVPSENLQTPNRKACWPGAKTSIVLPYIIHHRTKGLLSKSHKECYLLQQRLLLMGNGRIITYLPSCQANQWCVAFKGKFFVKLMKKATQKNFLNFTKCKV